MISSPWSKICRAEQSRVNSSQELAQSLSCAPCSAPMVLRPNSCLVKSRSSGRAGGLWQPTSQDLQDPGAEALHSLPCDVAPGHLEVVKGAESAGAMLGACKVNSFWFFEMGSGVNCSLDQIHLEGSGWTTLRKLALFTILEISCEVSVREQCRGSCGAFHFTFHW